jgi:hypothetical protein
VRRVVLTVVLTAARGAADSTFENG